MKFVCVHIANVGGLGAGSAYLVDERGKIREQGVVDGEREGPDFHTGGPANRNDPGRGGNFGFSAGSDFGPGREYALLPGLKQQQEKRDGKYFICVQGV